VRDDEIRRHLTQMNPWWQAVVSGISPTAWVATHRAFRDLHEHDMGYRSTVLDDLAEEPIGNQLVVLSGPRRIGKSVAVLQLVERLCERKDVDPRQIIHVPCDGMTPQDLRRVLVLGRALTNSVDRAEPKRRVWLLDEISAITGWSATLKGARDNTEFGDDTVVATGSRWADGEDIEGNLLAGRAGSGTRRRRVLLPMSFREHLRATRADLGVPDVVNPAELQSDQARQTFETFGLLVDDYDLAWQAYLSTGGFPRAVAEHAQLGAVTDGFIADLEAWLHRDVEPTAGPESIPLLLDTLSSRSTSPLSVNSAARDLGYNNKAVLDLRLRRMIASHALLRCPRRDDGLLVPGAQAKYYLTDPLLAWLPSRRRAGLTQPDMTRLTEATIAVSLARAIDNVDEGRWLHGDTIGYFRTGNDNEIDLAPVPVPSAIGAADTVPLESKWVDRSWKSESRTIGATFDRGIVATKTVLDLDGAVWAVPAPMVALALL
jgi:predicted AAA+ superfamily ATPase